MMQDAFDAGYFKQDEQNNIIPVEDPEERAFIAETAKKEKEAKAEAEMKEGMEIPNLRDNQEEFNSQLNLMNDALYKWFLWRYL